ncbi:class I SAM-dependent methyltransferase [Elioraea sp.]|uniref:class I SAM-dependent methyltransferase n=1 Tax=Elioraea sp. TaxID=2185103 RepID=UPI003F70D481
MEPDEYNQMDRVEGVMWWYRALHARVIEALRRSPGDPSLPLLDAGCGTGGLLRRLAEVLPSRRLVGLDVENEAIRRARRKVPSALLAVGSVDAMPFADGRFGAVVSCDVLCHRLVDEAAALAELRRVLAPRGMLVLNLPAHQWLHSAHDRRVHTARRYSRAELRRTLETAGFAPVSLGFWNALLLPLMVVQRKVLWRFRAEESSDVAAFSPPIDATFRAVTDTEAALARLGLRFPAGGSLLAVARRA